MVPVSQQTLRCCILLLTARGAYEQTVRRAGREEANHTAAGREDPGLTQPPLRCLLKSDIAVVCSHIMMRRHLLNSWIALHLSGPILTTITWGLTKGSRCLSICMFTSLLFHRLLLIFENPVLSKQWLIVARNTEKPSSSERLSELHFLLKSTPALARGHPCDSWC